MVERERKIKTQKKNLAKPGIWSLVLAVLSLTVPNGYAGLPWWLGGKEPTFQCRRPRLDPWVGKISCRRKWQPTPVFLPGKSHGQRSLASYSP